jgi:hypothetical protein
VKSYENWALCICSLKTSPALRSSRNIRQAPMCTSQSLTRKAGAEIGARGAFAVHSRSPGMVSAACAKRIWRAASGERSVSARPGPAAKEGQLKTDIGLRRIEGAGDVPPFGPEIRMRAVVTRESQFDAAASPAHRRPAGAAGAARASAAGAGEWHRKLRRRTGRFPVAYWALARTCATGSRVAWRAA